MGPYLTPFKIALLVLIQVHAGGAVPLCESIHVLSFLVKYISPDLDRSTSDSENLCVTLPLSQLENYLSERASGVPGRSIWDIFLKQLWAIDCSATLDEFIETLPFILAKTRMELIRERDFDEVSNLPSGIILRTSFLGKFLQCCYIEHARQHIQDNIALWQDMVLYRNSTRAAYEKKNNADERNMIDINLSQLNIDGSHPLARIVFEPLIRLEGQEKASYSIDNMEQLLNFHVLKMQRLGGRLSNDVQIQLKQMLKSGEALPKLAHYLKFLDSWRAGDYSSAFDNLHRYFDYTMQSRDRTFYQYALLNLAILQADFGCYAEAIPAMQEAIATARGNRDTECLNSCMSYLHHLGSSFPTLMKYLGDLGISGSEYEGLSFLKTRAKDAEMWVLLSASLISETKLGLRHGDSMALVFENIVKANRINIVKTLQNSTGPGLLMKGVVFGRIGHTHMAKTSTDIFIECYMNEAPLEDVLRSHCRLASLLVQQGSYSEAETTMESVPAAIVKVLKFRNYWNFHSKVLRLQRLLHWDDLKAAEQILRQLKGQSPDMESYFTLRLLEVDYLTRRGDFLVALQMVENLTGGTPTENNDIVIRSRLMTIKAGLWAKSGHALRGFSLVVRAANLSYNARSLPTVWEAILGLANIFNELHEYTASNCLLKAILPQVLECLDCDLAGRTHSLLADANMGLAGMEDKAPVERKELVKRAMEHVDGAFEQFKLLEDLKGQLEMLARKAKIQHFRGDLIHASDTASQYLGIRNKYAASHS